MRMDPIARDLGTVLADGPTITQEFEITNPGSVVLRLLGVEPLTPCCTRVDKSPESVEPGATGIVRVSLEPGFEAGRKALSFVVHTDSPSNPIGSSGSRST